MRTRGAALDVGEMAGLEKATVICRGEAQGSSVGEEELELIWHEFDRHRPAALEVCYSTGLSHWSVAATAPGDKELTSISVRLKNLFILVFAPNQRFSFPSSLAPFLPPRPSNHDHHINQI